MSRIKRDMGMMLTGLALGAVLTGGAVAAGVMAEPAWSPIYVDGQQVQMTAYNILGNNYVKLRDIGKAVGFNVYYQNGVQVDSDAPYTGSAPGQPVQTAQTSPAENVRVSCYKEGPLPAGDGTGLIIYPSGTEYTVTSSDSSIVSVEKAMGQFWKVNAISSGTAKITATGPDGQTSSVTVTVIGSVQSEAPSVDLSANMDIRLEMVRLINQVRRENGKSELSIDESLMNAAQDVSTQRVTEHRPYDQMALIRYGWPYAGMYNLTVFTAYGCPDIAQQAIIYWIESPGHFQTMLMEEGSHLGTGVTISGGRAYCYMVVGDPTGHNPYE